MELFTYLLKVTGCMAAFYIVYYTLLRKLTFFSLNRWYLLSALVISLVIPALHIGIQTLIPTPDVTPIAINTATKAIVDTDDLNITTQPAAAHINWFLVAACAYWTIASLLLLKLAVTLCGILYKAVKHGERQSNYRLINGNTSNNSSFFNCIFLNDKGLDASEKEQVIAHELVHVKRLHSADNLFIEVLKALLWFNPFIYLYAKALHQVHEFEVDSHLAHRYSSKNYAGLLLKLSLPGAVGLVNQFSAYGLKSRIGMLFSKPSAAANKLSYLLALPVMAALVYFLTIEKVYAYDVSNKNFVLVLDAGHGGKSGGIAGNIKEADIALSMVKQIKAIAEERGLKTVLTRSDDTDVPLVKRIAPGDVFVSIHANYDTEKRDEGMRVLLNRGNNDPQSEKLANTVIDEMKQLNGITISDKIYKQGIQVLRQSTIPAILVEIGYMSNKSDLQYITNKQTQHDMAEKFVDAIIAYKKLVQPKMSGAVVMPDTSLKGKVAMSRSEEIYVYAVPHTFIKTPVKDKYDDTVRVRAGNIIMKAIDESDAKMGKSNINLYSDVKGARYYAKTSSTYDAQKNILTLCDAQFNTPKFSMSAKYIRLSRPDSILFASGNVHLKVNNDDVKKTQTIFNVDTLTIDMRYHPKKKATTAN